MSITAAALGWWAMASTTKASSPARATTAPGRSVASEPALAPRARRTGGWRRAGLRPRCRQRHEQHRGVGGGGGGHGNAVLDPQVADRAALGAEPPLRRQPAAQGVGQRIPGPVASTVTVGRHIPAAGEAGQVELGQVVVGPGHHRGLEGEPEEAVGGQGVW